VDAGRLQHNTVEYVFQEFTEIQNAETELLKNSNEFVYEVGLGECRTPVQAG
jgi:hypothetical protein